MAQASDHWIIAFQMPGGRRDRSRRPSIGTAPKGSHITAISFSQCFGRRARLATFNTSLDTTHPPTLHGLDRLHKGSMKQQMRNKDFKYGHFRFAGICAAGRPQHGVRRPHSRAGTRGPDPFNVGMTDGSLWAYRDRNGMYDEIRSIRMSPSGTKRLPKLEPDPYDVS